MLGAIGAAVLLGKLLSANQRPRIFVSYHHKRDAHYRRLLEAWAANGQFILDFESTGPRHQINSRTPAVIKGELTKRLKTSDVLLVLVGEDTAKRQWVRWEITKAQDPTIDLPIVAVKLGQFRSPPELLGAGTIWARSFRQHVILEALDKALDR